MVVAGGWWVCYLGRWLAQCSLPRVATGLLLFFLDSVLCGNTSLLLPGCGCCVPWVVLLIGLVNVPWNPCCCCTAVGGVMVLFSPVPVLWVLCGCFVC